LVWEKKGLLVFDEGAFCPFPEKEKTEKNFITNSPNPRATCVCVN
jgi:hypothetical protein